METITVWRRIKKTIMTEIINKYYLRRLLTIAVPIMISNLILQLQMVIDRVFLGHADSIYMSALGNVITPVWASLTFSVTLATGASILISQGVGAKDSGSIEEYAGAVMKYNNIIPVLLFIFWRFFSQDLFTLMGVSKRVMPMCIAYTKWYSPVFIMAGLAGSILVILQTSNYTKPLVVYGITRSLLNIVLDWIMIFGKFGCPKLNIFGAGLATSISCALGFVAIFHCFLMVDQKEYRTRIPGRIRWDIVRKLLSYGTP